MVDDSDEESDSESFPDFGVADSLETKEDAIFIRNLPSTVKVNEIFDVFSEAGRIKV
jgi:RNA recognition motif-containing protein